MHKSSPLIVGMTICLAVSLGCGYVAKLTSAPASAADPLPASTQTQPPAVQALPTNAQEIPASTEAAAPDIPAAVPTGASPEAAAQSKDPIIFFESDLVSVNSMDRAKKVVDLIQKLIAQHPGVQALVASAGDNEQENVPTLSDYQNYFAATYGVFVNQAIFRPVRGNHDVQDAGHGQAYADYFNAVTHFDQIHIDDGLMNFNYSYDLGAWHIIGIDQLGEALNRSSLTFLKSDLAKYNSAKCQLVYWHVPTYSSGFKHGDDPALIPLNTAEYNAGVDIQINGHDHDYQRFYPINPQGQRDNAAGITTFIAGIGGQDGDSGSKTSTAQPASAVYMDTFPGGSGSHAIGVLMFTLHSSSADYTLYNANNTAVLDRGTVDCH
ncbi:MAG: metallophosphoesterase [Anaerolineaceae bacterium]|nr:metallophosphoesterase [Anaerolineaceae bacterium]